ncbi:MAG: glycosyltransferase family 1 protein [Pseudomonadota bacterium]
MTEATAESEPEDGGPADTGADTDTCAGTGTGASHRPIRVLLEMRPAFDGFAGIPQEVRLLFRGLSQLPHVRLAGLLQAANRMLARGLGGRERAPTSARRVKRLSDVVVSVRRDPPSGRLRRLNYRLRQAPVFARLFAPESFSVGTRLGDFTAPGFEDFLWRSLFAKTLDPDDRSSVTAADYHVCRPSWQTFHTVGDIERKFGRTARYPRLDTTGHDVFIGQTPYPGRVAPGTQLVIRYHDAIPLFMPHTIPDPVRHQAQHYHALAANVASGAWFSCVSEATRADLIRVFPEAEPRAVTIPNMIAPAYRAEDVPAAQVRGIVRTRLYEASGWLPTFDSAADKRDFYTASLPAEAPRYLLMVSTIEPRKNHLRLLAAWERLRIERPDLKLIVVGRAVCLAVGLAGGAQS